MWAEERLNVKRQQWNHSVHTRLLVMYGMFTQRSLTGARHSAPGSSRNHNSPGRLVKRRLLCGVHQTLSWGVTRFGGPKLSTPHQLHSFKKFRGRDASCATTGKGIFISVLWKKPQRFPRTCRERRDSDTHRVPWTSWSWCWPARSGWWLDSSFHLSSAWRRNTLSGLRGRRL